MLRVLLAITLITPPLSAALPNNTTTWEQRPGVGNDTNGAGFVAGSSGTDYSQFNNKNATACTNCGSSTVNLSTTDAVCVGTTTLTSATANFSAAIVGNIIFLQGGTGSLGAVWKEVTAFTNATTVTIDSSCAASTGVTMNIGGALLTLTQLNTNMGSGFNGWVKATATISLTSGFTWNFTSNCTGCFAQVSGYTTTRGDGGHVTLQATAPGFFVMMQIANNNNLAGFTVRNFTLDANGEPNIIGLQFNANDNTAENILVLTPSNEGVDFNLAGGICRFCYVSASTGTAGVRFAGGGRTENSCLFCVVTAGTGSSVGFYYFSGNGNCTICIAGNNAGANGHGFLIANDSGSMTLNGWVAYGNGGDGIHWSNNPQAHPYSIYNGFAWGNSGWCVNSPNGTFLPGALGFNYNGYGGCTSGSLQGISAGANDVTLTADPTTAGGSNNFALNGTAGGGAALKAAGFPGVLATGGTGFAAIGALQPSAGASVSVAAYPTMH
jgi:hypothetical protein